MADISIKVNDGWVICDREKVRLDPYLSQFAINIDEIIILERNLIIFTYIELVNNGLDILKDLRLISFNQLYDFAENHNIKTQMWFPYYVEVIGKTFPYIFITEKYMNRERLALEVYFSDIKYEDRRQKFTLLNYQQIIDLY